MKRRQVRFHPSAKTHDGLSKENAQFEQLIQDFYKNQKVDLLTKLSRDSKHTDVNNLVDKVRDLFKRIQQSGDKKTVLLPRGGGRTIKMSKEHLAYIEYLLLRVIQVRNECMRRHHETLHRMSSNHTYTARGSPLLTSPLAGC